MNTHSSILDPVPPQDAAHMEQRVEDHPTAHSRALTGLFLLALFDMIWGWIWGVGGALLAVPLLAAFKIMCDHLEPLQPIGEFLGK